MGGAMGGAVAAAPPAPSEGGLHDGDVFEQWQRQMVHAWTDTDYKLCSFKYIMYDDLSQAGPDGLMAPPAADVLQRTRAESLAAADTGLWERADRLNPAPNRFVPVQITGFTALQDRRARQLQAARDVCGKLAETQASLRALEDERRVAIRLRLKHYAERQQQLSHRVLRLYAAIERQHLLRCHGGVEPPLGATELTWIRKLHEIAAEMASPDAARLFDITNQLEAEADAAMGACSGLPDASRIRLDPLEQWLTKQQEAVRALIDVSRQDLKDVGIAIEEASRARSGGAAA